MTTQLTASTNLFNPDSRIIFLFEEKIGEIYENRDGFFAESVCGSKKAIFRTYNIACDFLTRCWEQTERKRMTKVIPSQTQLLI